MFPENPGVKFALVFVDFTYNASLVLFVVVCLSRVSTCSGG
jgi:hypothetical protein